MYAVFVIAMVALATTLYAGLSATFHDVAAAYRQQSRIASLAHLSAGIARFQSETGNLPASLDQLVATTGYADLRSYQDSWQAYVLSAPLNDGTWIYQRAVAISRDPSDGVSHADYLALNRCGAGGAAAAPTWCGEPSGAWFRQESREEFSYQMTVQRGRHHRMLHKWAAYYSVAQRFPDVDKDGNPLAAGSTTELRQLVGYAGTAAACSGPFVYAGIPVDCGELFDLWGGAVAYQYIDGRHIVIVSEAPFHFADNTRPLIATDLEVQ